MPELYETPRFYARLFDQRVHDVALYRWLAQGVAGPLLELGVGTGRVALPLLTDGHRVVGVERSAAMLDLLKQRLATQPPGSGVEGRLRLVEADARSLELAQRFPLILFPFNGLAHMHSPADLQQCLLRVSEHLAVGGVFAFDVLQIAAHHTQSSSHMTPYFEHPETQTPCKVIETLNFDAEMRRLSIQIELRPMRGDEAPSVHSLDLRFLSPQEIDDALAGAGLRRTNSVDLGDSLAIICRRR